MMRLSQPPGFGRDPLRLIRVGTPSVYEENS